ncbi:hypothetical protein IIA15_10235 [candidate division TA06 bacterium]|nr:hypothetical protein [candidate division TA06 bacterium]
MVAYGRFICFQCTGCGFWQGKENGNYKKIKTVQQRLNYLQKLTLKCKRCNRSTKFHNARKGESTLKHRWSNNAKEIEILVSEMNKRAAVRE